MPKYDYQAYSNNDTQPLLKYPMDTTPKQVMQSPLVLQNVFFTTAASI